MEAKHSCVIDDLKIKITNTEQGNKLNNNLMKRLWLEMDQYRNYSNDTQTLVNFVGEDVIFLHSHSIATPKKIVLNFVGKTYVLLSQNGGFKSQ